MQRVLVKIGGKAAENQERLSELLAEMRDLGGSFLFILVHGGGSEVTETSRKLGVETVFKDGIRQTSAEEMDIVDMVLSGRINKRLVRACRASGLDAVGVSGSDGGIFQGRPLAGSRTAEMGAVDARLLELLIGGGFLPVVSSTSMDPRGLGVNINADSVALGLSVALGVSAIVFLSDIPGVLNEGVPIPEIARSAANDLIGRGVITGGMIPKVNASLDAISRGVKSVIIGEYDRAGALADLLDGRKGTRIHG